MEEGVGDCVDAEGLAIVLRELRVCRDPSTEKAARWLRDMEEQLELFKAQREKDANEDEEEDEANAHVAAVATEDLRYIECLPHLLWWTLCSALTFVGAGETPKKTAADAFVPGQRNFDDFLCLMPLSGYQDTDRTTGLSSALCSILQGYDSHESVRKGSFPEDDEEVTEETRERHSALFSRLIEHNRRNVVDAETSAGHLELGCNLYASMMATVESARDDLSLQRWRECYLAKCKEIAEWLSTPAANEDESFQMVWERANAEPDYALLVPFTKREALFAGRRQRVQSQVHQLLVTAKKLFDVEHDHSQLQSDFECPSCGSFKTRAYPLQTRSADEGTSTLWKCWSCKKSGKVQ